MENDLFGPPAAGSAANVTHNLFFGLMPNEATRDRIAEVVAQLQSQQGAPRGRWLKPHRYHLTLHYLGSFQPLRADIVTSAGEAAAQLDCPAFDLVLDQAGAFPRNRVGWLGCGHVDAGLGQLWDSLRLALAKTHVKVEGATRFQPHVTVLRDAQDAMQPGPVTPVQWPVDDFVLVDSQLGSRNVYEVLGRWSLRRG